MPKYQIFIESDNASDPTYTGLLWDIQTGNVLAGWVEKTAEELMRVFAKRLRDPDFVKDLDLDPAAVAELLGMPVPAATPPAATGYAVESSGTGNDETGTPSPADHDYQKCEAEWRNARDQLAAIRAAVAKHMRIDPSDNTANVAVSALEFWFNAADVAERNGQQDRESNRKLQQENQNLRTMIDGLGRQLGKETQAANAEREACAKAAEPAPASQQSPSPAGSPPPGYCQRAEADTRRRLARMGHHDTEAQASCDVTAGVRRPAYVDRQGSL